MGLAPAAGKLGRIAIPFRRVDSMSPSPSDHSRSRSARAADARSLEIEGGGHVSRSQIAGFDFTFDHRISDMLSDSETDISCRMRDPVRKANLRRRSSVQMLTKECETVIA